MKKIFFALVLLVSLSFASLLWQSSTNGEITTKPVYFLNDVAVGSADGNVYAFAPDNGAVSWKTEVGTRIIDFTLFDGDIVAATTEGKITKLESGGAVHWTADLKNLYNVSYIYAIGSNSNYLYAATAEGIYRITKSGDSTRIYETAYPPTALAVGPTYLIIGAGNSITRINEEGQKQWESYLDSDNFWNSNPAISDADASVYIGALDNKLHAYHLTGGYEKWAVITKGWVITTPLIADSMVFFGSNDGNIYAVNAANGNIAWKTQLPLAVISEPEKGIMGGAEVIFAGGTDSAVYALDMNNGKIVWKGSAGGRVGSPLYYQKKVIFGSSDGTVYAYTTERACSIDSPMDGEFVAHKEVVISGQSVSEAGSQKVYVNLNGMGWQETNTSQDGAWELIIDPSQLKDGLNSISCRVVDAMGEESGESFTTVSVIKDLSIPLADFTVTTSQPLIEGEPFTVYVNSKEDGSPVDRCTLEIDGQTHAVNKNITLTLPAGSYTLSVSKQGFNTATLTLPVSSLGIDPLYIGVGIVILLIIVWIIYTRFIKKPKIEE